MPSEEGHSAPRVDGEALGFEVDLLEVVGMAAGLPQRAAVAACLLRTGPNLLCVGLGHPMRGMSAVMCLPLG